MTWEQAEHRKGLACVLPSGPERPPQAEPLFQFQGPQVSRPGLGIESAGTVVLAWTQVVAVWVSWEWLWCPGGDPLSPGPSVCLTVWAGPVLVGGRGQVPPNVSACACEGVRVHV